MQRNSEKSVKDTLPENFDSLEAFWDFWDSYSSADYKEFTEPAEIEIRLDSRNDQRH
jgi:hypothetical protein